MKAEFPHVMMQITTTVIDDKINRQRRTLALFGRSAPLAIFFIVYFTNTRTSGEGKVGKKG